MTCRVPPFAAAVLAEASRIAPGRRVSSDGVCPGPGEGIGDHYPSGPNSYAHAVDVSQSVPGAPFWQPHFQVFDAHGYARKKAKDWIDGHGDRRIKYMVIGQPGGADIIFNPSVNLMWRPNGAYKTDHRSHLHLSFTTDAEDETAPFFNATPGADDMPLNDHDIELIRQVVKQEIEDAIGGKSMSPPDAHATVVDVVKKYSKP